MGDSPLNGAERSGTGGRGWDRIKEKKVFYIITCTNGAERNGEWNGMEWNGMEWNRTKQNETEWNRMKQNEMEQIRTNTQWKTRWTERNGAEREEEIEIELKRKSFSISLHAQTERSGKGNGMEWNGMKRNKTEWNGMKWIERSGTEEEIKIELKRKRFSISFASKWVTMAPNLTGHTKSYINFFPSLTVTAVHALQTLFRADT